VPDVGIAPLIHEVHMTRDDAVVRIQQGLGFRTDLVSNIVAALKEAQRVLETGRSLPGFLMLETQSLVVPVGNAGVPLPTRFIREWEEDPPHYVSPVDKTCMVFPEKIDYNIGLKRFVGSQAGPPIAYTLRASSLVFWPARDINYTLTWSYFNHSKDLSTNVTDNEWLNEASGMPEALIGRAGMIIAADLADTPSLQKFSSMYSVAWAAITSEDDLGDEENRPLAMGARL
jgi:hypothetical protein